MDTQPAPTPDHDPTETAQDDAHPEEPKVGFWRRMFGGGPTETEPEPDPGAEPETGASAEEEAPQTPARNKPRKRQRTIFDRAEEEQRKRYTRAASIRREKLAGAIGDRVERVIAERMETGEAKLAHATEAFQDMSVLLGAIGHNLDEQGQRSERMADTLERLPEIAEKEQQTLEAIAERLRDQAHSVEGVPEVVSLVRQGKSHAQKRLMALQGIQEEMALQRQQRSHVLDVLRQSAAQFEERMTDLEDAIQRSALASKSSAERLQRSIQRSTEQMVEQAREEERREEKRAHKLREGLRGVGNQLLENAALTAAHSQQQQEQALGFFHESQQDMIERLERSQTETITEMHRIQKDVKEREERLAWKQRMVMIGAAGVFAIATGLMFTNPPPSAQPAPATQVVRVVQPPAKVEAAPKAKPRVAEKKRFRVERSTTLPAGMPRQKSLDDLWDEADGKLKKKKKKK